MMGRSKDDSLGTCQACRKTEADTLLGDLAVCMDCAEDFAREAAAHPVCGGGDDDDDGRFITPVPLPTPYERELLIILIEECAEVQQRAAKLLRFGRDEVQPGQPLNNAERLADEIGDLMALVRRVKNVGLFDEDRMFVASTAKEHKLNKYMQEDEDG
jgi:NTP pyrophosphatase (non-canonical NTP hydrolase)